jgi:hypothetical protein
MRKAHAGGRNERRQTPETGVIRMNARRIFAAAAFALVTAACGGGSGPTLADNGPPETPGADGPTVSPEVPPTDTTGFVPEDNP